MILLTNISNLPKKTSSCKECVVSFSCEVLDMHNSANFWHKTLSRVILDLNEFYTLRLIGVCVEIQR